MNSSSDPLYLLLTATAALIAGLLTGYNGFRKNRIDQSTALVNNAMQLVSQLREELNRVQEENAKLRQTVTEIEARIHDLEDINAELHAKLTELLPPTEDKSNESSA